MLKTIRDFFEQRVAPARDTGPSLELATAALLAETLRADPEVSEAERAAAHAAMREKFELGEDDAARLVALAEEEVAQANDRFQFTSLINAEFTQEQKIRVVELMWRVAYADATLSAHEQHVIRKIAELLHVPHGDYIHAKMRARDAAGLE